jgi:hypothetical protein
VRALIDTNLPPALARALNELSKRQEEVPVVHLRDRFEQDTPDHQWITELGKEGDWIVISKDRFSKGSLEKEALRRAGLTVFMLERQWGKQKFWNISYNLVRWWPAIIDQSRLVSPGAVFSVPWQFSGRFKQIRI